MVLGIFQISDVISFSVVMRIKYGFFYAELTCSVC